ncbi:MAG: hypothetical protein OXF79_28215 [Chloroflexi bacterium]|nr:hypothetical protein [Chloroflexota bacterium]
MEAEGARTLTGEMISIRRLFSEEVEIEHLIPFSKSWDDSAANKVVAMRFANRPKDQRAPYSRDRHPSRRRRPIFFLGKLWFGTPP